MKSAIIFKKIISTFFAVIFSVSLTACSTRETNPVEEVVKFESSGVFLEGVLNLPGSSGKYPVAIFVHGSGMATRNEYQEFVVPLLNEGIGVFRYDKRGVGASGGTYINVGTQNSEVMFPRLASDAIAGMEHLKKDTRIDSNKIIVIGGSQAGWIIPQICSMTEVWLPVIFSGPTVTVGEEIYYSDLAEFGRYSLEQADTMLHNFHGLRGFDPVSRIEKMKRPSLWVFGGRDVSIPIKRTLYLLDSIKTTHHLPVEVKFYPEADHGLFNQSTRTREDFIEFIVQWISKQR